MPRHVVVNRSAGKYPGILVERRRQGAAWKGYVIWADERCAAHLEWIDANQLEQA